MIFEFGFIEGCGERESSGEASDGRPSEDRRDCLVEGVSIVLLLITSRLHFSQIVETKNHCSFVRSGWVVSTRKWAKGKCQIRNRDQAIRGIISVNIRSLLIILGLPLWWAVVFLVFFCCWKVQVTCSIDHDTTARERRRMQRLRRSQYLY